MELNVKKNVRELGEAAAASVAALLRAEIAKKGSARALFSTGESQFTFFEALKKQDVQWEKVVFFHLDEYIGIGDEHPASFARYLKERFLSHVTVGEIHLIDGKRDPEAVINDISAQILKAPVDVGIIGIGENAHIAFNDPPADFETTAAFHVVRLSETCRRQQVNEGWFKTIEDVPSTAVSITVHQIMQCRTIISCVPGVRKSDAVRNTLEGEINNMTPASVLRTHPDWRLFLDTESAALLS